MMDIVDVARIMNRALQASYERDPECLVHGRDGCFCGEWNFTDAALPRPVPRRRVRRDPQLALPLEHV